MNVRCPKCGARATIRPTGRDRWTVSTERDFAATCPLLIAKLKEKGRLSSDEQDCPDLDAACSVAFNEWKRAASIP
jgi:hypothetical protein